MNIRNTELLQTPQDVLHRFDQLGCGFSSRYTLETEPVVLGVENSASYIRAFDAVVQEWV